MDFMENTVKNEWIELKKGLSMFTYFSKLNESDIQEACTVGKIKTFRLNETIFGDNVGLLNFTYFILDGKCSVIHSLKIPNDESVHKGCNISKNNIKSPFSNADISRSIKNSVTERNPTFIQSSKIEMHFIEVGSISSGGCFNLGEDLHNIRIIATNIVNCMLLPTYWLWQKNSSNIWGKVKTYLENRIPTCEQLYKKFVLDKHWMKYKNELTNDILKYKMTINNTSVHDIPYSIRIHKREFHI